MLLITASSVLRASVSFSSRWVSSKSRAFSSATLMLRAACFPGGFFFCKFAISCPNSPFRCEHALPRPGFGTGSEFVDALTRLARFAVSDLEFDPAIQRVAQIVGTGSDKVFAKAHANRRQASFGIRRDDLDLGLDGDRSLRRQPVVELFRSRLAGVADDSEARPGGSDFARDEAQPHVVRAADLWVTQELQGPRTKQEFDRKAVGCEAKSDDFRERFFRIVGTPKLRIREVETVEDAQLLSLGPPCGRLVVA